MDMLRISLWGKHFEAYWKGSKHFLTQKKSQVKTIGPLLDMLRISLQGIKHFQGQKIS